MKPCTSNKTIPQFVKNDKMQRHYLHVYFTYVTRETLTDIQCQGRSHLVLCLFLVIDRQTNLSYSYPFRVNSG